MGAESQYIKEKLWNLRKLIKKRQHYVPQFYLSHWIGREGIFVRNNISKKSYRQIKYQRDRRGKLFL